MAGNVLNGISGVNFPFKKYRQHKDKQATTPSCKHLTLCVRFRWRPCVDELFFMTIVPWKEIENKIHFKDSPWLPTTTAPKVKQSQSYIIWGIY